MKGDKFLKLARNPFLFKIYLMKELPLAWIAGLRIGYIDESRTDIRMKLGFWNKNPFKSLYFAAQCMAGEFASGVLCLKHVMDQEVKVSMLVVNMSTTFSKKAVGTISFVCEQGDLIKNEILESVKTGEGRAFEAVTVARDEEGDEVSRFNITWSVKAKLS